MNRELMIRNCFDAKSELSISNEKYIKFTKELFNFLLKMDIEDGDSSQHPLEYYKKVISCSIIVKEKGIAAGLDEISFLLKEEGLGLHTNFKDGDEINIGDELYLIRGEAGKILSIERTVLNILQRLCGIASLTKKYTEKIKRSDCFVMGTRKTLWGYWDKQAVRCGGGLSHRLNLADAAMLKENHLSLLKSSNKENLLEFGLSEIIKNSPNLRFVEVEVTSIEEFWYVVKNLVELEKNIPGVIMFDHFKPEQIKSLIRELKQKGLYDKILLEASGNITLKTIYEYSKSGIDVVSSGALTHSAPGLDLSLIFN